MLPYTHQCNLVLSLQNTFPAILQYALQRTLHKACKKVPWQCCHILDEVTFHEAYKTLAWQAYNMVEKDKKKFESLLH